MIERYTHGTEQFHNIVFPAGIIFNIKTHWSVILQQKRVLSTLKLSINVLIQPL